MTEVQNEIAIDNSTKLAQIIESPFASAGLAAASCAIAITVVLGGIGLVSLMLG